MSSFKDLFGNSTAANVIGATMAGLIAGATLTHSDTAEASGLTGERFKFSYDNKRVNKEHILKSYPSAYQQQDGQWVNEHGNPHAICGVIFYYARIDQVAAQRAAILANDPSALTQAMYTNESQGVTPVGTIPPDDPDNLTGDFLYQYDILIPDIPPIAEVIGLSGRVVIPDSTGSCPRADDILHGRVESTNLYSGLSDTLEFDLSPAANENQEAICTYQTANFDPHSKDCDKDGLSNETEIALNLDPNNPKSDGYMSDRTKQVLIKNMVGRVPPELKTVYAITSDFDKDGIPNGRDPDSDGNGLNDIDEVDIHLDWLKAQNVSNPWVKADPISGKSLSGDCYIVSFEGTYEYTGPGCPPTGP